MTGRIEPDWLFLLIKNQKAVMIGCWLVNVIYRNSLYFIRPKQSDYEKIAEMVDKCADLVQELGILQGPLFKL